MNNKNDLLWGLCMIIIGVATLVIAGSSIIGITLPDTVIRVVGIIDLIMLPVFAYTTVKKVKNSKK